MEVEPVGVLEGVVPLALESCQLESSIVEVGKDSTVVVDGLQVVVPLQMVVDDLQVVVPH